MQTPLKIPTRTILLDTPSNETSFGDLKLVLAKYAAWFAIGENSSGGGGTLFKCLAFSGKSPSKWTDILKNSKFQVRKPQEPETDLQNIQNLANFFENDPDRRPIFNHKLRAQKREQKQQCEEVAVSEDQERNYNKINEVTHADQWNEVVKYTNLVVTILGKCVFSPQLLQISDFLSTQFPHGSLFPRTSTLHRFNSELQKTIDLKRLDEEISCLLHQKGREASDGAVEYQQSICFTENSLQFLEKTQESQRRQRHNLFNKYTLQYKLIQQLKESVRTLKSRVSSLEKFTEEQLRPSYASPLPKLLVTGDEHQLNEEYIIPQPTKKLQLGLSIDTNNCEYDTLSCGQKRLFADQVYKKLTLDRELLAEYDKIKCNDNWVASVPVQLRDTVFTICWSEKTGISWIEMIDRHRQNVNDKKMKAPTYDLGEASQFFRV